MTSTMRMAIAAKSTIRGRRGRASVPSCTSASAAARSGPGSRSSPSGSITARIRRRAASTPSPGWGASPTARRRRPRRSPPAAGPAPARRTAARSPGSARRARGRSAHAGRPRRPSRRGPPGSRTSGSSPPRTGWASTLFSDASAAAVYWTSISPLLRPGSGDRNAGRPPLSRPSSSSAVRRSEIEPSSARASFAKSSASAIGSPWKLPPEITSPPPVASASAGTEPPSGNTSGLSVAELSSMSSTRRRWSSASRTAPWTWGTQRSEYGSWTLCADPWCARLQAGAAQQVAELGRDRDLPRVRPGELVRRGERDLGAEQRLDGHRRGDRRGPEQPLRVRGDQRAERAHQLRPVEQRQALLRPERERLETGVAQGVRRRHDPPVDLDLAPPDERQREVGERREVARRADAPLLRHDRVDAPRQELADPVDEQRPAARVTERQRVRAQQQHRAHDLARERPPDARGVRGDEVRLEPGRVPGRDERGREVTEARSSRRTRPRPRATSASITSRASCIRSRAWVSRATRAPPRATASTSAIVRSAPVRTTRSRGAAAPSWSGTKWASVTVPRIVSYPAGRTVHPTRRGVPSARARRSSTRSSSRSSPTCTAGSGTSA